MPKKDENIKLHLQEADDIKKKWFSYVFDNIHTLNGKIEHNTLQLQKEKEELLKLLMDSRDKLLEAIKESDVENKKELEKLRSHVEKTIEIIQSNLSGLTSKHFEFQYSIETELNSLRQDCKDNINTELKLHIEKDDVRFGIMETDIGIIKNAQIVLKTKIGVWVVILSLVVTTLSGGLLVLFKDVIKTFLGL